MPWVYLDDGFPDHPKVALAGGDAAWLFVCSLCWSRRHLSGGRIPKELVKRLSDRKRPDVLAQRLVEVRLWIDDGDAYLIHEYEEWNASEDQARQKRREKASRAASAKWDRVRQERMEVARDKATHTKDEWQWLVEACRKACVRCATPFSEGNGPQKDHIVPVYQGGSDGIDNLQPLCTRCNTSKGPETTDHRPSTVVALLKECLSSAQPLPSPKPLPQPLVTSFPPPTRLSRDEPGGGGDAEAVLTQAARVLAEAEAVRRGSAIGNPGGYVRARTPAIRADHEPEWRRLLEHTPSLTAEQLAQGQTSEGGALQTLIARNERQRNGKPDCGTCEDRGVVETDDGFVDCACKTRASA